MNDQYKPKGYNALSPYIIINGAQKLIDLLKELFDAQEMRRYDTPDGAIMHTELKIDDSILMIADATDQYPPNQSLIHIYVPDVDEVFNKAITLGFESVDPPKKKEGDPTGEAHLKIYQEIYGRWQPNWRIKS